MLTFPIDFSTKNARGYKDKGARSIKVAVLIQSGRYEKNYHSYEDVTRNLGYNLKIFFKKKKL